MRKDLNVSLFILWITLVLVSVQLAFQIREVRTQVDQLRNELRSK